MGKAQCAAHCLLPCSLVQANVRLQRLHLYVVSTTGPHPRSAHLLRADTNGSEGAVCKITDTEQHCAAAEGLGHVQDCQDHAGGEVWEAAAQSHGLLGPCLGPGDAPCPWTGSWPCQCDSKAKLVLRVSRSATSRLYTSSEMVFRDAGKHAWPYDWRGICQPLYRVWPLLSSMWRWANFPHQVAPPGLCIFRACISALA